MKIVTHERGERPLRLGRVRARRILGAASPDPALIRRIRIGEASAPEIIDLEVVNSIRKHLQKRLMEAHTAEVAVSRLQRFPLARAPHRPLIARAWQLRHSITPYDASYVALAERLGIPLVTTDARLARSNGHDAQIELYPVS